MRQVATTVSLICCRSMLSWGSCAFDDQMAGRGHNVAPWLPHLGMDEVLLSILEEEAGWCVCRQMRSIPQGCMQLPADKRCNINLDARNRSAVCRVFVGLKLMSNTHVSHIRVESVLQEVKQSIHAAAHASRPDQHCA